MFARVPFDVLCLILFKLPPEDAVQASAVNKQWYRAIKKQSFWKAKFFQHFPILLVRYPELDNMDSWYEKFKFVYEKEYVGLTPRQIKILSYLKEGDVDSLEKLFIVRKDIAFMLDASNAHNIILNKCLTQTTMDYLFKTVILSVYVSEESMRSEVFLWAVRLNQVNFVAKTLQAGHRALVRNNADSQLHYAAMTGNLTLYRMLEGCVQETTGCLGDTPLLRAIRYRNDELIDHLLLRVGHVQIDLFKQILDVANNNGCIGIIKKIYAKRFDLSQNPINVTEELILAAALGRHELVEYLLNAINTEPNRYDVNKVYKFRYHIIDYALRMAVRGRFTNVASMLLANGANPLANHDFDRTLLNLAVDLSDIATVEVLLEYNADKAHSNDDLIKLICAATQRNDLDIAFMLLQRRSVNASTGWMHEFLFQAVKANREDIVMALLELGVKPDALRRKTSCLTAATRNRNERLVTCLLQHGSTAHQHKMLTDKHPLWAALVEGAIAIADRFIKTGASLDVNVIAPLLRAIMINGQLESIKYLFNFNGKPRLLSRDFSTGALTDTDLNLLNQILYEAVKYCKVEIVKYLLSIGANVHLAAKEEGNLLDVALASPVIDGQAEVVQLLRVNGLVVTKTKSDLNMSLLTMMQDTKRGESCFQALIDLGADVNDRAGHDAPIFHAIEHGNLTALRCVLKNGARLNVLNQAGDTALHYACRFGNKAIIRELLLYKADVFVANQYNQLPIDFVAELHISSEDKHRLMELLIHADENMTPDALLIYAVNHDNAYLVNVLYDLGLVKTDRVLSILCELGSYYLLKALPLKYSYFLAKPINGVLPFLIAYRKGNVDALKLMAEHDICLDMAHGGIHCLIYVLRKRDIKTACAMVGLDENKISRQFLEATRVSSGNLLSAEQEIVIEAELLMRDIETQSANPHERNKFLGLFAIGETRTQKIDAMKARLNTLLQYETSNAPVMNPNILR